MCNAQLASRMAKIRVVEDTGGKRAFSFCHSSSLLTSAGGYEAGPMPLLADEKGRIFAFPELHLGPGPLGHQVGSRHHGSRSRKVGIRSQRWNFERSGGFTSTLSLALPASCHSHKVSGQSGAAVCGS